MNFTKKAFHYHSGVNTNIFASFLDPPKPSNPNLIQKKDYLNKYTIAATSRSLFRTYISTVEGKFSIQIKVPQSIDKKKTGGSQKQQTVPPVQNQNILSSSSTGRLGENLLNHNHTLNNATGFPTNTLSHAPHLSNLHNATTGHQAWHQTTHGITVIDPSHIVHNQANIPIPSPITPNTTTTTFNHNITSFIHPVYLTHPDHTIINQNHIQPSLHVTSHNPMHQTQAPPVLSSSSVHQSGHQPWHQQPNLNQSQPLMTYEALMQSHQNTTMPQRHGLNPNSGNQQHQ